jgi:hypothetical protein
MSSYRSYTAIAVELFDFENLTCFGRAFEKRVVNFVSCTLLVDNFLHLVFRDEPALESESVLSKVLSTKISHMVFIDSLFLLLPIL